jgi:glycosyltransferase involved in cell wall biosynthesis
MPQIDTLPVAQICERDALPVSAGELDGVTIMRYAHVNRQRASGGVEQYLRQLDRGLLQRHRLTVLQMHLVAEDADETIETENVGLGKILWVPVAMRQVASILVDLPTRIALIHKRTLRQGHEEGKGQFHATLSFLRNLSRHRGGHLRYRTTVFSDRLPQLLATHKVDLLSLHWLTYDTDSLMRRASNDKVPFVLVNHFDNRRFSLPLMRKWAGHAAAIGAVSGQHIPDEFRDRSVNLSDAVDTEFFAPQSTRSVQVSESPIVFLPGRIDLGKGHRDLIEAARIVAGRKLDFVLYFAGAVDSQAVRQELGKSVAAGGLEGRVFFLGEKSAEEIRNLYSRSRVVVLPSHSEGLGRVLIEAQAMKKPVIAYDAGGMSEAFLPDKSGFLVKTGDVEALADKIGFLLQNEAEGLRLGERGREFVEQQFSVPALVRRHEAFYLHALSDRQRAQRRQ